MAQDNLQPQTDQELEFKKRARRRLVGAVALVLLMIVVLPMVLQDRTAQAPKQDVVVSIPSQDQGLSQSSEAQAPATEVVPAPIQEVAPESAPAEPKVAEIKQPETSVSVASNDKPIEAPKAEAPKPAPVKSESKSSESKASESKASASGSYFVQIGVFSDPDNVKQMQDKLTEKGLKTRTESIDTAKGKKTRLRVGPFADKKEAEAALEKVKSLSLTGMIVSAN